MLWLRASDSRDETELFALVCQKSGPPLPRIWMGEVLVRAPNPGSPPPTQRGRTSPVRDWPPHSPPIVSSKITSTPTPFENNIKGKTSVLDTVL